MTARELAKLAGGYGYSYREHFSDEMCLRLAFSRIAQWIHAQDEVSDRTIGKVREALNILVKEWNEEADDLPQLVEDKE